MVLEGPSFCITEDKSKGEVVFENCWLVSEDTVQLFSEAGRVDSGQAKIITILKSVVSTKSGTNLWPMLPIGFCYVFFATGNEVGWNKDRISFPTGTSGSIYRVRGGWCSRIRWGINRLFASFCWRGICGFCCRRIRWRINRLFASFCLRGICSFCCGTFTGQGGGLFLMRGANMSVVWCAVVERFTTCVTGERAFDSFLVVGFQVTIMD